MFFFGKKHNENGNSTPNSSTPVSSRDVPCGTLSLKKSQESLERKVISLRKEKGVDLAGHRARVFVVMDRSGSMHDQFHSGAVQETLTRLLPLALKFDDNGELEVYVFNTRCEKMPSMDINNYENYVEEQILRRGKVPTGGTNYAPVVEMTTDDYNDGSPYPAFGIFITDGDTYDEYETDTAIRRSSKFRIFYQFVGLGNGSSFRYLQKLDDLDGRSVDNTAFVKVSDFRHLSDDQLYDKLLEQYPDWLRAMHIM